MKYISWVYNVFFWAMCVALLCFKSEWLEMRVNLGWVFFGAWIVFSLIALVVSQRKKYVPGFLFSLINTVACFILGILLYGYRRLGIVPAAILREGIGQTSIPFGKINLTVGVILLAGLIAIFIWDRKNSAAAVIARPLRD